MHTNCTSMAHAEPVRFAARLTLRPDIYAEIQEGLINQNMPPHSLRSEKVDFHHSGETNRPANRPCIWSASSLISVSTISLTNSSSLTLGRHPNLLSALLASPCRMSTSFGRKYFASISTYLCQSSPT